MRTSGRRVTYVWLFLSAITVVSWRLGSHRAHGQLLPSTVAAMGVLAIALVKARFIIQEFMEVRAAPRWLHWFTDGWLSLLWATLIATYLY
jgi:hypothetical protein